MIKVFGSALPLLVALLSFGASGAPAPKEATVSRAVFAAGRLWLVSNLGDLSSVADGETERSRVTFPDPVSSLCVKDGQPAVLTGKWPNSDEWTLRRLGAAGWTVDANVPAVANEYPQAMVCDATKVWILTSARLIVLEAGRQTSVALSRGTRQRGGIRSVHATDDALFVGLHAGEWGGGLFRVDRRSGAVTSIEAKTSGEYCKEPLDAACDPVNAIETEPWAPGCILAAVGLVHMSPRGRLVEVCGDRVRTYRKVPYGPAPPLSTLPFFGLARMDLARTGDTLRALAADGLYTIDRRGIEKLSPLPAFRDVDGVAVSFAAPGVVLVLRDIGHHQPPSGNGPILVVR